MTTKNKINNINKSLILKIVITIVIIFFIVVVGHLAFIKFKDEDSISGVRKILSVKYDDVECIDEFCNGFIVKEKNESLIYNNDGKKVADYKENKNETKQIPVQIGDDYYISKLVDSKLNIINYSVRDKNGDIIYETINELTIINDNVISMFNKEKNLYTLLDKKGKIIYENISDIKSYLDKKYIQIKIDDNYILLDKKANKILDNYSISKVSENNDFFILKNEKENNYNYFSLDKEKIIGNSFNSYIINEDLSYTIINNKNIKYTLLENGKQKRLESELYIEELTKQLDLETYDLYEESVYEKNQKYILVDNKKENSVGVLNTKNNKYEKIYDYKKDNGYARLSIDKLKSNNNEYYFKLTCLKNSCNNKKSIIYNLGKNKKVFETKKNQTIYSYTGYDGGYKVIKYNNSNKYILYDKKNKILFQSNNDIAICDKKLIIGQEPTSSLSIYSAKKEKLLSDNKVSIIKINNDILYRYKDKNDNIIILNKKGKKIINVNNNDYFVANLENYIYIKNNIINIYNINKDKTYKYKLKENETLNDESGKKVQPYRGIIINNTTDKYVKILNYKTDQIKKLNNLELSSVRINLKDKKIYLIVKKNIDKEDNYGVYVVE